LSCFARKESALRSSSRVLLAVAILAGALVATLALFRVAEENPRYYVALGDSLAAGEQPVGSFDRGYANQLYGEVRDEIPGLRLKNPGCSGETTDTMLEGGICTYPSGSQLDEAVAFLQAHPARIAFVTIDIGINDALACYDADTGAWPQTCVEAKLPKIRSNLARIIEALKRAAPGVPIVGMDYYDPFLGYWVQGQHGHDLARTDERALETLNAGLKSMYRDEDVLLADVAGPDFFDTANFADMVLTEKWGRVPVNVAQACKGTWFCEPCPTCPDIHGTTAGYGLMAKAFKEALATSKPAAFTDRE
jgi:lysophospholipase L1-like esterase